jgi:hypothetical protein
VRDWSCWVSTRWLDGVRPARPAQLAELISGSRPQAAFQDTCRSLADPPLRRLPTNARSPETIDLLNNTLAVRRTIHRVSGRRAHLRGAKSKRSHRTLALPLPLVAELHRHKTAQLGEPMLAGSAWHDEDLVFARPTAGRSTRGPTTTTRRACCRKPASGTSGCPTAGTLLLSENVHPRVVMELLGDHQRRTTTDIDSHVMPALAARPPTG